MLPTSIFSNQPLRSPIQRCLVRCLELFLALNLATAAAFCQSSSGDFSIVALPDSQIYSRSYPQIFYSQTQWIANHVQERKIKLVLGLGDIVNGGGEIGQWQTADAAMRLLDGKVPYMMAIGNHDYDRNDPASRTASTKNFNQYFGPSRYAGRGWYRGSFPKGSNENFYGTFTFGGKQFLVLMLEVFPRDTSVAWARSVLNANLDKEVILVTHAYTYTDNTRIAHCDLDSSQTFGVAQDNDGDPLWEKLVRNYPNISLVLSGHVAHDDGTGRRNDLSLKGNLVHQMLSDYQSQPQGGGGYLRIITFRPALNRIDVVTYSPYLNAYKTDAHNQFSLMYKYLGASVGTGSLYGRVKSALDCAPMAGVTVSSPAGTTKTDANGYYSMPASGPRTYVVTSARTGWLPVTRVDTVLPGLANPGKVLMSTAGKIAGTLTTTSGIPIASGTILLSGGVIQNTLTLTTTSAGTYATGWVPVGNYGVQAWAPGYARGTSFATVTAGQTAVVNVKIGSAVSLGSISGTVSSAVDGHLIVGAVVSVSTNKTLTDGAGRYSIPDITAGTYNVSVTNSGWQSQVKSVSVTAGANSRLDFKLATCGVVTGLVTVAGVPAPGFIITFKGGVVPTYFTTTTNSTGKYNSGWIPVGRYTVTAWKSGYAAKTNTVTLTTGNTLSSDFHF